MVDLVSRTPTDPQVFKRFDRIDARLDRLEGRVDTIEANMVTKTEFAQEFAKLYKHLMFGGLGICAVTVTVFAAVVTLS